MNKETRKTADIEKDILAKIDEGNSAIRRGNFNEDGFKAEFSLLTEEYATQKEAEVYAELAKNEGGAKYAACEMFQYPIYGLIVKRGIDSASGERIIKSVDHTIKNKRIELLDFCQKNGISTEFAVKASLLNRLSCMWLAQEFGHSKSNIANIAQKFFLKKELRANAESKPQISNNVMRNALQDCLTEIDERLICNNFDLKFLQFVYARVSNEALKVRIPTDKMLNAILMHISHRIAVGGQYDPVFRVIKTKTKAGKPKDSEKTGEKKDTTDAVTAIETKTEPITDSSFDFDFDFEPLGELEPLSDVA